MSHTAGYGKKTGDDRYIPIHTSVCPWALLIIRTDVVVIRKYLLRSWKGMLGSHKHQ